MCLPKAACLSWPHAGLYLVCDRLFTYWEVEADIIVSSQSLPMEQKTVILQHVSSIYVLAHDGISKSTLCAAYSWEVSSAVVLQGWCSQLHRWCKCLCSCDMHTACMGQHCSSCTAAQNHMRSGISNAETPCTLWQGPTAKCTLTRRSNVTSQRIPCTPNRLARNGVSKLILHAAYR